MRMRAVNMRVRRFFFLFAVTVRVTMAMPLSVSVRLCDRMTARVPIMSVAMAVVMVMSMGGWRVCWFWNPTLFAYL
jgi:hypothetical protein